MTACTDSCGTAPHGGNVRLRRQGRTPVSLCRHPRVHDVLLVLRHSVRHRRDVDDGAQVGKQCPVNRIYIVHGITRRHPNTLQTVLLFTPPRIHSDTLAAHNVCDTTRHAYCRRVQVPPSVTCGPTAGVRRLCISPGSADRSNSIDGTSLRVPHTISLNAVRLIVWVTRNQLMAMFLP